MYINGESNSKTDEIEVQEHGAEKDPKITIGIENTNNADTRASLTSNIFILFDQYVTKTEASKIYVYYWGHCEFFVNVYTCVTDLTCPKFFLFILYLNSSTLPNGFVTIPLATTISTDRFINVNFENKAGEDIALYPDKGEHKTNGYSIKPRMILELRLVEQGTQTNFPVTFRAKSTASGESLPLDGEQTYVATPSEKSTQVFIVDITKPCKFLYQKYFVVLPYTTFVQLCFGNPLLIAICFHFIELFAEYL